MAGVSGEEEQLGVIFLRVSHQGLGSSVEGNFSGCLNGRSKKFKPMEPSDQFVQLGGEVMFLGACS